jgi:hypothetical protein
VRKPSFIQRSIDNFPSFDIGTMKVYKPVMSFTFAFFGSEDGTEWRAKYEAGHAVSLGDTDQRIPATIGGHGLP